MLAIVPNLQAEQTFRVVVSDDGVYRISARQLVQSGLTEPLTPDRIAMSSQGRVVPVWWDKDSTDASGDISNLYFIGHRARSGDHDHHQYRTDMTYWLKIGQSTTSARPLTASTVPDQQSSCCTALIHSLRHEQNIVFAPLTDQVDDPAREFWYWSKLSSLGQTPFSHRFDAWPGDADTVESGPSIRLGMLGWSAPELHSDDWVDHHLIVQLNGTDIGEITFNGKRRHEVTLGPLDPAILNRGENVISIRVKPRFDPAQHDTPLIDLSYLDWIEVSYPADTQLPLTDSQIALRPAASGQPDWMSRLQITAASVQAFSEQDAGLAWQLQPDQDDRSLVISGNRADDVIWLVGEAAYHQADQITEHTDNRWPSLEQTEYLMISHASLIDALQPLAEFHRQRNRQVSIIDVQDVHDRFNHGVAHPKSIRALLQTLHPGPLRWVLLVGDASWHAPLAPTEPQHDLIPSWQVLTRHGPAASDQPFVELDPEQPGPELALGRLPMVDPEDLSQWIDKMQHYSQAPVGPWRMQSRLLHDQQQSHIHRSHALIAQSSGRTVMTALADTLETDEARLAEFRQAFDQGALLMHFLGHGGRYMWQTGESATALDSYFDLQQLDLLRTQSSLPMVLSMTCNSGPFDHPNADSLAEKLLRLPDRGAIAVLAASARNSPNSLFSNALLEQLSQPGTIGSHVLTVKQSIGLTRLTEVYNLFGDPAMSLALPQQSLRMMMTPDGVRADLPAGISSGQAEVWWMDDSQQVLKGTTFDIDSDSLLVPVPEDIGEQIHSMTLYVWNSLTQSDAAGSVQLQAGGRSGSHTDGSN